MLPEGYISVERPGNIRTITLSANQVLRLERSLLEAIKNRSALSKTNEPTSENSDTTITTFDSASKSQAYLEHRWIAAISNILASLRHREQVELHPTILPKDAVVANIRFTNRSDLSYDLTSTQLQNLLYILFSDERPEDNTEPQCPDPTLEDILQTLQIQQEPVSFKIINQQ